MVVFNGVVCFDLFVYGCLYLCLFVCVFWYVVDVVICFVVEVYVDYGIVYLVVVIDYVIVNVVFVDEDVIWLVLVDFGYDVCCDLYCVCVFEDDGGYCVVIFVLVYFDDGLVIVEVCYIYVYGKFVVNVGYCFVFDSCVNSIWLYECVINFSCEVVIEFLFDVGFVYFCFVFCLYVSCVDDVCIIYC